VANNTTITRQMRTQGVWENAPIIGGLVRSWREMREAASGRTNQIRVMGQEHERALGGITEFGRQQGIIDPMFFSLMREQHRSEALRDLDTFTPVNLGPTARTTSAQLVAYREAQAVAGPMEAFRRAQAEQQAAQRTVQGSETHEAESRQAVQAGRNRLGQLDQRINRIWNDPGMAAGPQRVALMRELNRAQQEHANLTVQVQQHESRINQSLAARQNLAQATLNLRQAEMAVSEAELGNLRRREQSHRNVAATLGAALPHEREMMVSALETLQREGLERTHPLLREQARRLAPEFVQQMEIQFGDNQGDLMNRIRRVTPELLFQNGQNLEQGQQQVDALQRQVMEQGRQAARQSSEIMSRALASAFEAMQFAFIGEIRRIEQAIRRNQMLQNIHPGGA
jgi:hypothetical protein